MMKDNVMKVSTAIVLALAGATATIAQPPRVPGPDGQDFARHEQQEGDDLALLLGLKPGQRSALTAFLAAMRPPRPEGARPSLGDRQTGFEEEMAQMEARDAARADDERSRIAAARSFYAQLDPRQKQLFEAVMRLRHEPGGPGLHGPDGPGMRGPGEPGMHGSDGGPPGSDRPGGHPPAD